MRVSMNQLLAAGLLSLAAILFLHPAAAAQGTVVAFDKSGVAQVDGEPFFPIGIFTYHLDDAVMQQIREKRFNTIIHGFEQHQLDRIHAEGLKAIVYPRGEWLEAAKEHPALLAWYLADEPEGHGQTPAEMEEAYHELKARDPHHPIGLCHFLYEAIEQYKDAADFTMSDVYPVTANRDVPLRNVGIHIWRAHTVHGGRHWPVWAYIQVFGGPDTDGGKWAQPTPQEVRAMTFMALAQGATGILYFSYWPKAPATWSSVGELNRDLHRLVPWLASPGEEMAAHCSLPEDVWVRARRVEGGGGILLAVNLTPEVVEAEIGFAEVTTPTLQLRGALEPISVEMKDGRMQERLLPYAERVYVWGE